MIRFQYRKSNLYDLFLASMVILLVACNPASTENEEISPDDAAELATGAVIDENFIRAAAYDAYSNMLTVEVNVNTTDQVVLVRDARTETGVAAVRINVNGLMTIRAPGNTLSSIPCVVEAISATRFNRMAVANAPSCGQLATNVSPVPKIISPNTALITILQGNAVSFTGQADDPENNGPFTFVWDFNGAAPNIRTISANHTNRTQPIAFNRSGTFEVKLRVSDNTGQFANIVAQTTVMVQATGNPQTPTTSDKMQLGKRLFNDHNLSSTNQVACINCHDPIAAWAEPNRTRPTSEGVGNQFGTRNTLSIAYTHLIPGFSSIGPPVIGGPLFSVGGLSWDGSTTSIEARVRKHFVNGFEMGNNGLTSIITQLRSDTFYAASFDRVYGAGSLNNTNLAIDYVGDAIKAYIASAEVSPFTSKFDAMRAGRVRLTAQEELGFTLFTGIPGGGSVTPRCSGCHVIAATQPLFTNNGYYNLGLPRNREFPFNIPTFAPVIDTGLGQTTGRAQDDGKFKAPSLRNVGRTGPYMHNGILKSLLDVVKFFNTGQVPGYVGVSPEVPRNVTPAAGNMYLTSDQERALVAFMLTLTDGYNVPSATPLPTPHPTPYPTVPPSFPVTTPFPTVIPY